MNVFSESLPSFPVILFPFSPIVDKDKPLADMAVGASSALYSCV
jgi:hypothetical protein